MHTVIITWAVCHWVHLNAAGLEDATAQHRCNGKVRFGLFMRNLGTVEVGVMLCKVQTRYLLCDTAAGGAQQQACSSKKKKKTMKSIFTSKKWEEISVEWLSSELMSLTWSLHSHKYWCDTSDISVLFWQMECVAEIKIEFFLLFLHFTIFTVCAEFDESVFSSVCNFHRETWNHNAHMLSGVDLSVE